MLLAVRISGRKWASTRPANGRKKGTRGAGRTKSKWTMRRRVASTRSGASSRSKQQVKRSLTGLREETMKKAWALAAAVALVLFLCARTAAAQSSRTLSPEVQQYVRVSAPVVALTHVRVIDGTGAAAKDNQTIVISGDNIQSVGDASSASVPPDA